MKLSDRIRPDVEAAPWVIEEVKKLEAEVALLKNHYSLDAASKLRAEVAAARSLTALREHERDEARAVLRDFAEYDCEYGDNCPSNAGTRHGTCVGCKARQALEKKP